MKTTVHDAGRARWHIGAISMLAAGLTAKFGQPFVARNLPGATGAIIRAEQAVYAGAVKAAGLTRLQ